MCDYCDCSEKYGKNIVNYNDVRITKAGPYGGITMHTDISVRIMNNNQLAIHSTALGYFKVIDAIENKVKINFCPICGDKLSTK